MNLRNLTQVWPLLATVGVVLACTISNAPLDITILSIIGILFVLGVAYQKPISQLYGAGFCGMLAYVSFNAGFYANAGVNGLILLPLSIYGYYIWKTRGKAGQLTRKLSKENSNILYRSVILISMVLYIITTGVGSALPLLDAITGILPVVATCLMVGAYKEQWIFWILYNILQAIMWFSAASAVPAVLAVFVLKLIFLINSLIGFYLWKTENK